MRRVSLAGLIGLVLSVTAQAETPARVALPAQVATPAPSTVTPSQPPPPALDEVPVPAPQSPCRVSLARPAEREVLYGPTEIAATVACPPGAAVEEIEFSVDGRVVGRGRPPSWSVTWDAGAAFAAHVIVARLRDREGGVDTALLATPGAALRETIRVPAIPPDLVELSVSVTDAAGRPMHGLTAADFLVEEEGRPRDLLAAHPDDRPLSLALLIDVSSSLKPFWPVIRQIAPALARSMRPGDALRVVAFSGPAYLVQEFTSDPTRIARSMDRFRFWGGGTSLYDTLAAVGTEMAWTRGGRQAVVLVTDGIDTLSRVDPDRLRDYLRRTPVVVETLLVRPQKGVALPLGYSRPLEGVGRETGGALHRVAGVGEMEAAFQELTARLQDRYYLSWRSDEAAHGGWRSIRVRVRDRDAMVRTRRGIVGHRPVGDFLVADLRSGNVAARAKAAEWLGALPADGGADALLEALADGAAPVRAAAAVSLGRIREPRAIDPLVGMLTGGEPGDRVAAAEALRSFGPAAVTALLDAYRSARLERQSEILPILADIADPQAVETVIAAALPPPVATAGAGGETPAVRERRARAARRTWALGALGRIRTPHVMPALEKGARDRDPEIRAAAFGALAAQAPASFHLLLDLAPFVKSASPGAAGPRAAAPRASDPAGAAAGAGAAGPGADPIGDEARAAIASGLARLDAEGQLAAWLSQPAGAAEFLDIMTAAVWDTVGDWSGVLAAVGGNAAAAKRLEDIAPRLPIPAAMRAVGLAERLRAPS